MLVESNGSRVFKEITVEEALDLIEQLSKAVKHAMKYNQSSFNVAGSKVDKDLHSVSYVESVTVKS